jgi:hypothetical protein
MADIWEALAQPEPSFVVPTRLPETGRSSQAQLEIADAALQADGHVPIEPLGARLMMPLPLGSKSVPRRG